MIILKKELRQNWKAFLIWTAVIAFMLVICVLMFPEMSKEMDSVTDIFANMGSFSAAFGMDQINFGEIMGFYGVECGNMLGIGGGFFAAYLGISILSKEEKEHTAEFLFSHPISRSRVLAEKLGSVFLQILAMNVIIVGISILSFQIIHEDVAVKEFFLLHLAYLILQFEIACICFGISAFLRQNGIGIGLGLAAILYFANIICNLSEQAEFLKYITPFAYGESTDIIANASLELPLVGLGVVVSIVFVILGFGKYTKKDLAS